MGFAAPAQMYHSDPEGAGQVVLISSGATLFSSLVVVCLSCMGPMQCQTIRK